MSGNYAGDGANKSKQETFGKKLEKSPCNIWTPSVEASKPVTPGGDQLKQLPKSSKANLEEINRPTIITNKFEVNICRNVPNDSHQTSSSSNKKILFSSDSRNGSGVVSSRFPLPRLPSYHNRETQFLFQNKLSQSLASYCFEIFVKSCCLIIDSIFLVSLICDDGRDVGKPKLWDWFEWLIPSKPPGFSVIEPDMES